jgi:hypothetical protein
VRREAPSITMIRMRLSFLASSFVVASLAFAGVARAQEVVVQPAEDRPTSTAGGFQFKGRAIYAGGGVGTLTDLGVATENWSIVATFPLARWLALETSGFGFHFEAPTATPGRMSSSVALGIGVGLRLEPPPESKLRPYLAARFEHIHMLFDPYDAAAARMDPGPMQTTSMHRWGIAGALGLEVALSRRMRAAVEAGPTLFSGTGTNGGGQGLVMLGVGF